MYEWMLRRWVEVQSEWHGNRRALKAAALLGLILGLILAVSLRLAGVHG